MPSGEAQSQLPVVHSRHHSLRHVDKPAVSLVAALTHIIPLHLNAGWQRLQAQVPSFSCSHSVTMIMHLASWTKVCVTHH